MGYLINCEYFNNLNENEDMAGMGIMAGICTSPYPSPYPTEKVGNSPYPVNAGFPSKRGRVRAIPTRTDLFAISKRKREKIR